MVLEGNPVDSAGFRGKSGDSAGSGVLVALRDPGGELVVDLRSRGPRIGDLGWILARLAGIWGG